MSLALSGCGPRSNHSQGVQLVLSTEELAPETTFELRFEQPMAHGREVGQEAEVSPLLFRPALPGRFVWTSPRGGVFTPQEPMALGTEYELSLRPGLTQADGQPTQAQLRQFLRTPPFGVVSLHGPPANQDAPASPEHKLWFNAPVQAAAVAPRLGYVNAEGQWIGAEARQGTEEERWWYGGSPQRTWRERFENQRQTKSAHHPTSQEESEPTNEIPNLVFVQPARPLSAGHQWRLLLGFPRADENGAWSQQTRSEVRIGDVREFAFQSASMHHVLDREPYLDLAFTKGLSAELTNSFTNWVQIVPWPKGVRASVGWRTLSLEGGWERGTDYLVTVRRGLPAAEPFVLAQSVTCTNSVPPIEPRLYFTQFSTEQLASGNRTFPLLAVNVGSVRVRAKLLDSPTAIHALRGYESYFVEDSFEQAERFRRLEYNLVPGRTVFEEELAGSKHPDVAESIPLKWDQVLQGRKTGVVFLEAERARSAGERSPVLGTQALVQLTDLGLAWKTASNVLQAFVFSYGSGQPVTNARVQLFSNENEPLGEARSDELGVARLVLQTNAAWLAAQADEDLHLVKLGQSSIPFWRFDSNTQWRWAESPESRRAALFTDRDVYRPGESIHLKAIARDLADLGLSIPAGSTGLVICTDAQSRQFFETNVTLNEFGSCAVTMPLPASPCGSYEATLNLEGREFHKRVQVADYQPAAFEIHLEPKAAYAADEGLEVPVSARYLFGQPLSRAQVRWWIRAEDQPFQPEGFGQFQFTLTSLESRWGRQGGTFAVNGQGQLGAGTNFVLQSDVPLNTQAPQPRSALLLVEVTDLDQQTITRSAEFVKHSSAFYLGLKRFEQVLEPGKSLPLEIAAVGANGKPWSAPVPAHVTLSRVEWQSVRIQGAGRAARYHNEPVVNKVLDHDAVVQPPVKLGAGEEGFAGSVVEGLVTPGAGQYLVEVSAQDEAGHRVVSSLEFNVTEPAKLGWDYRNEVEVKLVPDKASYQVGESALVLVKAPMSGTAWVTVERDRVLRSFVTHLEGNAPSVRVPLQAGDAPNVFVSVTLVRGATESTHRVHEPEYRVGYCQLKVEDPGCRLQVEVTPSATNCLPGASMEVTARVRDAEGKAVPNAEVTLYAVDEGVLSLTDYATPDLESVLLAPCQLGVSSFISLPCLMPEDPERLTFGNKGYLGGGGGYERLRHHFLACAFWNAGLRTDAEGRVSARFTAPDSLTRYRVIAVAQTLRNQFGSGKADFSVSKPLMLEPALPQFANLTDVLRARAVVQNQTAEAGDVLVTLQLDKAQGESGTNLSKSVHVNAHSSTPVEFPVTFTSTGSAQWIWRARFATAAAGDESTNAFSDSVQSTLQVGVLTPMLREVVSLRLEAGETNLLMALNPQLLTGEGTLTVSVANTRLVTLREAILQLLHYPYGCVEQTGSSLLPWIVLQNTPALLALTGRDPKEAAAVVKKGILRFWSMQTSSGGLAYWPGGKEPHLWGSAYGGLVLELARQSGVSVPDKELDALLDYLSKQLRQPAADNEERNAQCLALYVLALAERAEPAYQTQLFEQRERLSLEDRALLALGIGVAQQTATGANASASAMAAELLRLKPAVGTEATAGAFDCSARQQAIRLLALLTCQPGAPEAEPLFQQLQADQRHGHWETTQGNAWALLALQKYLRQSETNTAGANGSLAWGDERTSFQLEANCGLYTNRYLLSAARGAKPLLLAKASRQPLYVQLAVESRPPLASAVRLDHGFSLQRRYERLSDDNQAQPVERWQVGDRVLVTLRVAVPEAAQYVAVEDPLPGVLEAVNAEFKTQQVALGNQATGRLLRENGEGWYSDYSEIRADRVLFFGDYVPAGSYVIQYVARVRAAGKVTAPVAKAEAMYQPDRFGLSETVGIETAD